MRHIINPDYSQIFLCDWWPPELITLIRIFLGGQVFIMPLMNDFTRSQSIVGTIKIKTASSKFPSIFSNPRLNANTFVVAL